MKVQGYYDFSSSLDRLEEIVCSVMGLLDHLYSCRSEEHGASDQLTTFGKCLSEECSHVEKDNQA